MRRTIGLAATVIGIGLWSFAPAAPTSAPAPTTIPLARRPPAPAFEAHVVADNLVAPWAIAFLPDGRMLFTERSGKVRVVKDAHLVGEPALVVSDIKAWVKMGLLGVAVDPAFATNRFVYLAECYGGKEERDSWVRVVRYEMTGDTLASPTTLIDRIPAYLNHSGGRIKFGPDGKLYITTGDSDRPPLAQDKQSLAGKILRLNSDGSIPDDNPFAHDSRAHPAVWSFGHRNAQGLAWRGDTLFAPEHGPNGGDEINRIVRGANYGWPIVSHDRVAEGMTKSVAEYTPSIGPGDATFYDGAMFPELKGDLLVACLRGESILRLTVDDAGDHVVHAERLLFKKFGRLREVTVGPDGAIWITTSEVDPPEGRNNPSYDQLIKLTRGTGVADASAVPDANTAPRPVGAVALFDANCASCHGRGVERSMNSSLFDRQWQFGDKDDDLRKNIREGIRDRGMPAYGELLTREEIDEIVRFIRVREEAARR